MLETARREIRADAEPGLRGWILAHIAEIYLFTALAVFLSLAAHFTLQWGDYLVDDAYISLTYARSLAEGAGLTWVDGARVEGYTNFLWVLLGAAAFELNLDPVLVFISNCDRQIVFFARADAQYPDGLIPAR